MKHCNNLFLKITYTNNLNIVPFGPACLLHSVHLNQYLLCDLPQSISTLWFTSINIYSRDLPQSISTLWFTSINIYLWFMSYICSLRKGRLFSLVAGHWGSDLVNRVNIVNLVNITCIFWFWRNLSKSARTRAFCEKMRLFWQ